MFKIVKFFFEKYALDCKHLVGICTDGAPSMINYRSGFKELATNVALHLSFTHCFYLSLCFSHEILPSGLQEVLQDVVKIVNYISANATSKLLAVFCEEVGSDYKVLLLHTRGIFF